MFARVAEWFKAVDLRSTTRKRGVGSNPTPGNQLFRFYPVDRLLITGDCDVGLARKLFPLMPAPLFGQY